MVALNICSSCNYGCSFRYEFNKPNIRVGGRTQWLIERGETRNSIFAKNHSLKKIGERISQHAAQLNGAPSNNLKTLAFLSSLYRQESKIYPSPSKKSEN